MFVALTLLMLATLAGVLLRRGTQRARPPLADEIDAVLPQTQCTQCGYRGCRPYAEAIARGEADINQCPPGGEAGVRALARVMKIKPKPLNPAHGPAKTLPTLAVIDEALCIGCTLCIQACPVDAIVGANKQMHTVIAEECTGCELCVAPCPVDCIRMQPLALPRGPLAAYGRRAAARAAKRKATIARRRHQFRLCRLERDEAEPATRLRATLAAAPSDSADPAQVQPSAVLAAIERARAKRAVRSPLVTTAPRPEDDSAYG